MSYSLESLPEEFLFNLALLLSIPDSHHLSLTNKRLTKFICNNEYFWECKFRQDHEMINYQGS